MEAEAEVEAGAGAGAGAGMGQRVEAEETMLVTPYHCQEGNMHPRRMMDPEPELARARGQGTGRLQVMSLQVRGLPRVGFLRALKPRPHAPLLPSSRCPELCYS